MLKLTDKLPEIMIQGKDGKWYNCMPFISTVKGGKAVIYVAEDGTEVKREPLARYKAREARNATAVNNKVKEIVEEIGADISCTDLYDRIPKREVDSDQREQVQKEQVQKQPITIYHGSECIIKSPEYGKGKVYNDYGLGFYTTRNKGLAGEWAVLSTMKDGYINEYLLEIDDLTILNLDNQDIKCWIALLMENRQGTIDEPVTFRAIKAFKEKYLIDVASYDVIIGWRADDSYFSYVEAFASGNLSLESLQQVMKLGNLGLQVCLKSSRVFTAERLTFVQAHKAEMSRFYSPASTRDAQARRSYTKMVKSEEAITGTLIRDLI